VQEGKAEYQRGTVDSKAHLPTAGEVFQLRKLMPVTGDYDFNIHIMDFKPGEHLNVKVGLPCESEPDRTMASLHRSYCV
jgi:(S)-ureidoglycine aminohydrolase